jgi:tryptophan halogenase
MKTNNIIIVGGGTAGWMTATTLVKLFPKKNITLIESPNIKTIGVGESTIGQLNKWLSLVGINSHDFMKSCNAVFKFSIRFNNFLTKKSGYFDYPFGRPENIDNNGENLWFFKKILEPKISITDYVSSYYPIMALVDNKKVYENNDGLLGDFIFDRDVAYHFDATKFGLWLRDNICKGKINHIKSEVKEIKTDNNGIKSLNLDNGDKITGDLFIDCTGFKSMLLGEAMGDEFIPYNDILPNNKAWATHIDYTDKEKQMVMYAFCDAISNGWIWTTPLWDSIGTGYVYSDKFISDEKALIEFKEYLLKNGHNIDNCEFNKIIFKVGIHKRLFIKNVVAIGLSAGFVEPLESNGLATIHEFLFFLSTVIDRGDINQYDRDSFTFACRSNYQTWVEFVALHYALSLRDDTPYWKANIDRIYDKSVYDLLPTQSDGFIISLKNKMVDNRFPSGSGISCISTGMNWFPMSDKTLKYANYNNNFDYTRVKLLINEMDKRKNSWNDVVKDSSSLYEYLKKGVYNEL